MPISDQSNQSWVVDQLKYLELSSMLDVGAGAGTYAHVFAQHFPHVERFAVEAWAPYIQEFALNNMYTEVFNHDIRDHENFNYDIVIFGDVLEHLYDPWSVLKKVRSILPVDGQIACCIPNAQHWSMQARLSIGDWRYADAGLLDRTHIRFFTRQTIIELLQGAGFEITEIVPRYVHNPNADKFLDIIKNLAATTGADPKIARADASVFQYIVKAR